MGNGPARMSECLGCGMRLYRRDDPVYGGSVLAVGAHACEQAATLMAQATTASTLFTRNPEYMHARCISRDISADAWVALLRLWTIPDLVCQVMERGGRRFVVSWRLDVEQDMDLVRAHLDLYVQTCGDGPAPERWAFIAEPGRTEVRVTDGGDTSFL